MTTTGGFDPSSAPGALLVEHCDIPVDMTLDEWRRCGGTIEAAGDAVTRAIPASKAPAAHKGPRLGFRRTLRLA